MQPDRSPHEEGRPRRMPRRRNHGELAVLMTAFLLLACWAMLVL